MLTTIWKRCAMMILDTQILHGQKVLQQVELRKAHLLSRVERSTYYLLLLVRILGLPNSLLQEVCIRQQVPHVLGPHEHNIQRIFIISQHVPAQELFAHAQKHSANKEAASSRHFHEDMEVSELLGQRRIIAGTNSSDTSVCMLVLLMVCTYEEQSCWHSEYVAGSQVQVEIVL